MRTRRIAALTAVASLAAGAVAAAGLALTGSPAEALPTLRTTCSRAGTAVVTYSFVIDGTYPAGFEVYALGLQIGSAQVSQTFTAGYGDTVAISLDLGVASTPGGTGFLHEETSAGTFDNEVAYEARDCTDGTTATPRPGTTDPTDPGGPTGPTTTTPAGTGTPPGSGDSGGSGGSDGTSGTDGSDGSGARAADPAAGATPVRARATYTG